MLKLELVLLTSPVQQDGVVLGDCDLLDTAQLVELNLLQLVAEVLTNNLTTCSISRKTAQGSVGN